jgi:membrane protein
MEMPQDPTQNPDPSPSQGLHGVPADPPKDGWFATVKYVVRETFSEWAKDKASRLAAALSYYTIFSLAPLLLIAISIAGFVFGRKAATDQIVENLRGQMGEQGAQAIQTLVRNSVNKTTGIIATVIGVATLLIGASGAFGQLQESLNTIWEVQPKPGRGWKGMLRDRLLSFALVLLIGFLLMCTLVLSAVLSGVGKFLAEHSPFASVFMQSLNFGISFALTTALFAIVFKVLPDAYVRWRDVWAGAFLTALLFSLGRFAFGLYLARSSVTSVYGAAGSIVVVLLWIYYSAQILFLGAEFTQVYAGRHGRAIRPKPNAEPLRPPDRFSPPAGAATA